MGNLYDKLKGKFARLIKDNGLQAEQVIIKATPLSPEQAIGNPEDKDYSLIIGVERLMQAEFKGVVGQAFTDMYGNFNGRLSDVVNMDLKNNYRRAIFISSLNAVMRHLGLIDKTVHCHDTQPRECSQELVKYIAENYGQPRIAMVGFQPRMVEALAKNFELKVTDMDKENIGSEKFGVVIADPAQAQSHLDWCDIALVTGSTIVNGTASQFINDKPVIFFGVTISGPAKLLGLNHFCALGG